jgi:hypothetical protein
MQGLKKSFSLSVKLAFSLFVFAVFGQEDYTQWTKSRNIVINTSATGYNITADVTNFPLAVRLSKGDSVFSQAKAGGADVRFAASDATQLPYQIELWDAANLGAIVWVKVNTIRANNATQYIRMHWGKSDAASRSSGPAVFEAANGFSGVWHLAESPVGSGAMKDATTNANHGTQNGGMTEGNSVAGVLGKAAAFDGSDDWISCGENASLGFSGNNSYTLSAWLNCKTFTPEASFVAYGNGWLGNHMAALLSDGFNYRTVHWGSDNTFSNAPAASGKWQFVSIVYNATTREEICFVNGVQADKWTPAVLNLPAAQNLYIGRSTWNANVAGEGIIDEAIIAKTARSAAWLRLCYQSQRIPIDAVPVVKYAKDRITIMSMTPIEALVPAVSGVAVDSLTISPALPDALFFSKASGEISGWWTGTTAVAEKPYIVRAYNEKGFGADTIYITLGTVTSVLGETGGASPAIEVLNGPRPAVHFSFLPSDHVRVLRCSLHDSRGKMVWSSAAGIGGPAPGAPVIPLVNYNGSRFAPGLYLVSAAIIGRGNAVIARHNERIFYCVR